jgi:hypothetical protein
VRLIGAVWIVLASCAHPAEPEARVRPLAVEPQRHAAERPPQAPDAGAQPACSLGVASALPLPELESSQDPSGANLRAWVHLLAGPELRGREAGSADSRRAARLIADHFVSIGAPPPAATGHCQEFSSSGLRDQNVIAHFAPDSASCPWILIGAHYDSLGIDERGLVYPGADDNASGVAVLLELSRLLAKSSKRPRVGVVLAAFGAEEKDLGGSRAYVGAPTVPLDRIALMVNVDMAGRRPRGYAVIGYEAYGRDRVRTVRDLTRAARRARVDVVAMRLGERSDSASFAPHVPTVFLCTAVHADYHQPSDTPDRVDFGQVDRMLRVVLELVETASCER